jgi:AcrR family transcriptional regulator
MTPERILKAATDLFAQNAYSAVSVDQIAQKAGLTKMTVYQHFKSKEQVFLECLQGRISKREAMLDAFFAGLPPDRDPLLALFDWLENWTRPDRFKGCAFVKAVSELSNVIPQVRQVAFEAKQLMKDRIVGLAKASGRPHPIVLGEQLALLVEGAQSLALVESSNRPVRTARAIAVALLG